MPLRFIGFSPNSPDPACALPSSDCATFSHPMGEGHLPLPWARNLLPWAKHIEAERKFADRALIRLHPIPAVVPLPSSASYDAASLRDREEL